MQIEPIQPLFAARVTGLDIGRGLSAEEGTAVRAALDRHSVLVFPGQAIGDAAQLAFSKQIGSLEVTRAGADGAGGYLLVLTNIGPDGRIAPPTDRVVLNNLANRLWHADSSFKPVPARASMLSAREIPAEGADTEFASMRAAWTEMPEKLKRRMRGRIAVHDFGWSRSRVAPSLVTESERADWPPVRQPVVLDSPHGEALYLGAHARTIEEMEEAEARALIDEAMAFATQPRFVLAHRWQPHDIVLWDNRAVLHRATPFRSTEQRRHMVRSTIAGDRPLLATAAAAE
jgi:alpha-ketoglutarate-dependent 2,4-dichlorophenoxyacetate dioxygenase